MRDTATVEMFWGEVPVRIRKETIDCSVCKKQKLTDDEQYACEVCGNVGERSVWHP